MHTVADLVLMARAFDRRPPDLLRVGDELRRPSAGRVRTPDRLRVGTVSILTPAHGACGAGRPCLGESFSAKGNRRLRGRS